VTAIRIVTLAVGAVGWSALAFAQGVPPMPPPNAGGAPAPAGAATTARPPAAAPAPAAADLAGNGAPVVGPVPTGDETPAASDHDAILGHIGVGARHFDPGPLPLALAPGIGCPTAAADTAACEVNLGALDARTWLTRNLALSAGLAFGVGGGRDATRGLDTHFGIGPIVGLSLLLANWRHLAISASPELAYVWFRPGGTGGGGNTTMVALQAALEAEVHFGFIGAPALSVGLLAGMGFQYESAGATRVWSVGVLGRDSTWGPLSNLFVRYYL
jgi:hypothetical protein